MTFEGDAFISYAHLDDAELVPGTDGWVANFHRALEIRLAQLLGEKTRIWRDPKLQGNEFFADTLVDRLRAVAALVAVVSPAYVKSDWCLKEITAFCKGADVCGGIRVRDKARVFKVLKTPVALEEQPTDLQSLLGYEFFKVEPESGRVREFSNIFGAEAEREFWTKLYDVAQDLSALLEVLKGEAPEHRAAAPAPDAVYLAITTTDLRDPYAAIKRDLEQHGYTVLPDRALQALSSTEAEAAVREDLARCRLSVHLVGRTYSAVPEGGIRSLTEIQNDLATERAASSAFSRLIWIPPGLQVADDRQRKVIDTLRMDPRLTRGDDLLETPLEELCTLVAARLRGEHPVRPEPAAPAAPGQYPQLYFIYDQRDGDAIKPWSEMLFEDFEIIHPIFEGDEASVRDCHEENLRSCDGVLIFYGAGNDFWLRQKLRELQKSLGYGRTKPMPVVGICLIAPKTPAKERFATHEAIVMPQWDGATAEALQPFVSRLKAVKVARPGNAAESAV